MVESLRPAVTARQIPRRRHLRLSGIQSQRDQVRASGRPLGRAWGRPRAALRLCRPRCGGWRAPRVSERGPLLPPPFLSTLPVLVYFYFKAGVNNFMR